jgi:hypothetical protein
MTFNAVFSFCCSTFRTFFFFAASSRAQRCASISPVNSPWYLAFSSLLTETSGTQLYPSNEMSRFQDVNAF